MRKTAFDSRLGRLRWHTRKRRLFTIALRSGALPIQPAFPDAVYSGDGEELRQALENIGLVMYVGLMPYLKMIPEPMRQRHPQLGAYAYGTSLYVDIDVAA